MRKAVLLCILIWGLISYGFAQDVVPSKVEEVVVYPGVALVTRVAEASVEPGMNEILVETSVNRSMIDTDSVTAKVVGKGILYGVEYKQVFLPSYPKRDVNQLRQRIKELELEIKRLDNKKLALNKEAEFLNQWLIFAQSKIKEDLKTSLPSVEEVTSWLEFARKRYEDISQALTQIAEKKDEVLNELNALKNELDKISSGSKREKFVFVVTYEAKAKEKIKVYVSYLVRGASWRPVYRTDVVTTSNKVNILMQAKVIQTTGENWDDVEMTISSVTPMRGVELPTLNPWFVDVFVRRKAWSLGSLRQEISGGKLKAPVEAVEYESSLYSDKGQARAASYALGESVDLGIAVEYKLPGRVTVKSDGSEKLVPVIYWQKEAKFYHYSVPKKREEVYWVCEFPSGKEFLSGMMNVFVDGAFVGKTFVRDFRTRKKIVLALGKDKAVRITRKLIEDKRQETFFGKLERSDIVRKFVYKITITNLKSKPVTIKVIDALPVSKTDRIKIKNVVLNPEPTLKNYEHKKGVCLWQMTIPAKTKRAVEETFTVIYPKDAEVNGI